ERDRRRRGADRPAPRDRTARRSGRGASRRAPRSPSAHSLARRPNARRRPAADRARAAAAGLADRAGPVGRVGRGLARRQQARQHAADRQAGARGQAQARGPLRRRRLWQRPDSARADHPRAPRTIALARGRGRDRLTRSGSPADQYPPPMKVSASISNEAGGRRPPSTTPATTPPAIAAATPALVPQIHPRRYQGLSTAVGSSSTSTIGSGPEVFHESARLAEV